MEDRTLLEQNEQAAKNEIFDEVLGMKPQQPSKWRYVGHDVLLAVREFFCGKQQTRKEHDTFTDVAETIILQEANSEMLEISRKLLEQQRILENTHARRRLERWATRVISWYLIIVLILVVTNGVTSMVIGKEQGFISSGIVTAILSTTTINIIGLGLIVLRGHFPQQMQNTGKQE